MKWIPLSAYLDMHVFEVSDLLSEATTGIHRAGKLATFLDDSIEHAHPVIILSVDKSN